MTKLAQALTDAKAAGWSDWIKSEADERAVRDGFWFDVKAAEHVVTFFETYLRHTMGRWAGQAFKLLPWQRDDFLMPLFGWKAPDGTRRFQKGDVFVAKKQGKSTIAAGVVNYMMLTGGQRAEVYGVAHTREQAGIIYNEAAAMVRSSPQLRSRLKPLDSKKRINYGKTNSYYQALAGEASSRGVEGINPVCILFDEIHVQRSRELYDGLTYASVARENSLMLSVSTVGVADPTTIWWEQYQYAKGIIDGSITDHRRFALVYQADDGCKDSAEMRADPKQWAKAMPSLGSTVPPEKIEQQVKEAENSPAKLSNLLRYLFNVPTASVDRVVPMEDWHACSGELPDLAGATCYGGLDVASSEDLAAFALWFPELRAVKCWLFCPADKVTDRERRQQAHYRQWVKDGWLIETEGNRIDHDIIRQVIVAAVEEHTIGEIGFDPWNADAIVNPLMLEGVPMVSVPQTLSGMATGCAELLKAIATRGLVHDGNPVLSWCLGNCAGTGKDDAIRFDKQKSAEKIDGAVALSMAFGRATVAEDGPLPGVF